MTHIKCIKNSQWPTLSMVEALVCRLEDGRDNGGYILGMCMCNGHSLVASYSSPNFFCLVLEL